MRRVLWVLEVMLCVMFCIPDAVEGGLCLAGVVGGTGGDASCAALYAGGRGGWTLPAGSAGVAGGDAMCASQYGGCGGWAQFRGFEISLGLLRWEQRVLN